MRRSAEGDCQKRSSTDDLEKDCERPNGPAKKKKSEEDHAPDTSTSMVTSGEEIARRCFEYLDHPADIQIHSWGKDFIKASAAAIKAMYGYMTNLAKVDPAYDLYFEAKGRDKETLLYAMMHEALANFQSEPFFVGNETEVISIEYDEANGYKAIFKASGETFDLAKHPQEADIKAITYSNMQILETPDKCDIYVIVDI